MAIFDEINRSRFVEKLFALFAEIGTYFFLRLDSQPLFYCFDPIGWNWDSLCVVYFQERNNDLYVVRLNERILESRGGMIGGTSYQADSTVKQRPVPAQHSHMHDATIPYFI